MTRAPRHRPSPAMVVAFVALIAALSGSAIALPGKNKVDKNDIKKNAVGAKQIKKNAVAGSEARNNSLTGADINEATLGQVPSAGTAGSAASAGSANSFGGMTATKIERFSLADNGTREVGTFGPFSLSATCDINDTDTDTALITLTTTQSNSAFVGEDEAPDLDAGGTVSFVEASITPTGTPEFAEDGGVAVAPDGTEILGHELYAGVNVFNSPGTCSFGGVVFVG